MHLFQLTPFPHDLVKQELLKYPRADIVWLQEEHKNMGGWTYVQPRIQTVLSKIESDRDVKYVLNMDSLVVWGITDGGVRC